MWINVRNRSWSISVGEDLQFYRAPTVLAEICGITKGALRIPAVRQRSLRAGNNKVPPREALPRDLDLTDLSSLASSVRLALTEQTLLMVPMKA